MLAQIKEYFEERGMSHFAAGYLPTAVDVVGFMFVSQVTDSTDHTA